MEENKNKKIDAFFKKQFQDIPLESPSKDFTSNIMDMIQQEEVSTTAAYKPLISKKVWILVAAAFTAVFFIPFQKTEGSLLSEVSFDLSFLQNISFSNVFDGISVSSTVFYGFLFFGIMLLIQVLFLKDHFNKRITTGL